MDTFEVVIKPVLFTKIMNKIVGEDQRKNHWISIDSEVAEGTRCN